MMGLTTPLTMADVGSLGRLMLATTTLATQPGLPGQDSRSLAVSVL